MSNSSLHHITFKGETNLKNTDFRDSTIQDIKFDKEKCDCEGVNFSNCKLIGIHFDKQIILDRAIFKNADLIGMGEIGTNDKEGEALSFKHVEFSNANLTHQNIYNTNFDYSDFFNARLIDCKLGVDALKKENTTFIYANLEKADLLRAFIQRCKFDNANLKNASFTYSKIEDVSFMEARLHDANFTRSEITGCSFEKTYCTNMTMKSAIINNVKFYYAILTQADMSGANIFNVKFNDTVCRGTLWVNTKIRHCDFKRSVLADARIVGEAEKGTRIVGCDFSFADFSNIAIANVTFEECNFYGVDFYGARLVNVKFIQCVNLDNTNMDQIILIDVLEGENKLSNDIKKEDCRYILNS